MCDATGLLCELQLTQIHNPTWYNSCLSTLVNVCMYTTHGLKLEEMGFALHFQGSSALAQMFHLCIYAWCCLVCVTVVSSLSRTEVVRRGEGKVYVFRNVRIFRRTNPAR